MYKKILIATDGSELAGKGVAHGLELAKGLGASVTFLNVSEAFPALAWGGAMAGYVAADELTNYEENARKYGREVLDKCKAEADAKGVAAKGLHVENKAPAEAILEVAASEGSDLIVMASHGRRGIGRLVLGSQTAEVVSLTKIPVLVVR
ncbi:universal stress protein [Mesorhizobium sp. M2D.F.Ca.ET.185.01.1.1]|uniref:universal stress protein n=1 Tax=unclassified Mesorhizobium TaxID=325217 RepID=UPI000FC9D7CB|nr:MULTISPECIES: universal stress protein [unclassified Mesorhizobium]TGP51712.1 universal stress protein [bacterium M00.F.Ca.ET.230.01.1.1]TGP82079.1 universal stress protein [bacterium M00.F.Ca.ET.227.01.1.1]TGP92038.1 universal stress protein [bacterium M00.F.Ca.ET.221.01.1.1]TGP95177.1 universal stress protein [bacterium M00.F.Ca.ET.222.01.1.1]TGT71570.1 universal stress protein [bacterium M00.F.Ca.ET.159.01.1.1]TGT83748.1 universal stress protein [bacterium M00.F.Ca.ET.157.01.1.1]TGU097